MANGKTLTDKVMGLVTSKTPDAQIEAASHALWDLLKARIDERTRSARSNFSVDDHVEVTNGDGRLPNGTRGVVLGILPKNILVRFEGDDRKWRVAGTFIKKVKAPAKRKATKKATRKGARAKVR